MGNKQLFEKQSNSYNPIYPLVRLEDIIDTISDKSIQWILNNYNHIYVEYSESVAVTRNKVPQLLRRTGIWISYNASTEVVTEYYKGDNKDVTNFIKWTNDDNWERFDKIKHLDGSITYQHLSESLRQLIGQGNNITNFPDDEDLEVKDGLLKLKDRDFEPNNFSGLGRVILRKNIKAVDGQPKNVLTQDMINKENTIYEIRYDFDLGGQEITIPEGCVLDFQGGSFNNGIIVSNNTLLEGNVKCYCSVLGRLKNGELSVDWFGCKGDMEYGNIDSYTDNTPLMNRLLSSDTNGKIISFENGTYGFSNTVVFTGKNMLIKGKERDSANSGTALVIANDTTLFRFKGRVNRLYGLYFNSYAGGLADSESANLKDKSIGIHMAIVDSNDVYDEFDNYGDVDSTISNCTFVNLNTGVYVLGRNTIVQNCGFSLCRNGVKFDNTRNVNPSALKQPGGTGRGNGVKNCSFHGMTSYYDDEASIVNLSPDAYGFIITGNHQDTYKTFFKGNLIRSSFKNNYVRELKGHLIYGDIIKDSYIEGNSIYAELTTNSISGNVNPIQYSIISANSIFNTIISNNYFDEVKTYHIECVKYDMLIITNNTFKRWGSSLGDSSTKASIIITDGTDYGGNNRGVIKVNNNVFKQEYVKSSYLISSLFFQGEVLNNTITTNNNGEIVGAVHSLTGNVTVNISSNINKVVTGDISSIDNITSQIEGVYYVSGTGMPEEITVGTVITRKITPTKIRKTLIPDKDWNKIWFQDVDTSTQKTKSWININTPIYGVTDNRPTVPNGNLGLPYFDITLNKPIWWTGEKWVDATGADV